MEIATKQVSSIPKNSSTAKYDVKIAKEIRISEGAGPDFSKQNKSYEKEAKSRKSWKKLARPNMLKEG